MEFGQRDNLWCAGGHLLPIGRLFNELDRNSVSFEHNGSSRPFQLVRNGQLIALPIRSVG